MNKYDDLFEKIGSKPEEKKERPTEKKDWAEKKRLERAEAYKLLEKATEEITNDPEKFRDFLNTQAQFDRYSVSNSLLIAYQRPGATRIADFAVWKEEDVSINKGEKAITILEPGNEYTRDDGSTAFSVNVKKVFDISQTSCTEINMRKRKPDERAAIKALIESSPCEVVLVDELKTANARYSADKNKIFIVKGLEGDEIFRSLAFEIGIAKCASNDIDRKDGMFAAYCSSYILCERNGFDTGNFNFEKVPERFAKSEAKDRRRELGSIREMANEISQDMIRQFEAMDRNRRARDDGAR